MTLTPISDLVAEAHARGGGLAAFNLLGLESAQALISAAERAGLPLILQVSQNLIRHHGDALAALFAAVRTLAEESSAALAVHLDHAEDEALARRAIRLGFDSVMYDGAALPDDQNRARTAAIVSEAHAAGVWVEAELGEVGGKDGAHAPGVRTDPNEAADFVAHTGVDALAVAVGSSHARKTRDTILDLKLISRLREAVPVPLVLHGSSGVPDDGIRAAIAAGITKVNVSTHLNGAFTAAVRRSLEADAALVDPRKYLAAGRTAMSAEAERLLRVISLPSSRID